MSDKPLSLTALRAILIGGVVVVVAVAFVPAGLAWCCPFKDKTPLESAVQAAEGSGGLAAAVAVFFAALAAYWQAVEIRVAQQISKEEGVSNRKAWAEQTKQQESASNAQSDLAKQFQRVADAQEAANQLAREERERGAKKLREEEVQRHFDLRDRFKVRVSDVAKSRAEMILTGLQVEYLNDFRLLARKMYEGMNPQDESKLFAEVKSRLGDLGSIMGTVEEFKEHAKLREGGAPKPEKGAGKFVVDAMNLFWPGRSKSVMDEVIEQLNVENTRLPEEARLTPEELRQQVDLIFAERLRYLKMSLQT